MPLGLLNQNKAICRLEFADQFSTGDAIQRSVNVEVDILADESDRAIAESGMTAAHVLTCRSPLTVATIPASQSESHLAAAPLHIGCPVSSVVNPGTVADIVTAANQ